MAEDKITFEDVEEYEGLFSIAPSFLLEGMIRRNSNLVLKFKGPVKSYLNKLTPIKGINYLSFLILKYPICRRLWQNHTKKLIKNNSSYWPAPRQHLSLKRTWLN